MQRRYVWKKPRVRDLLDSLYRGYPSGAILLWETDEEVPLQDFAISQQENPYQNTTLLLDGQQRLTPLAAIVREKPVDRLSHPGSSSFTSTQVTSSTTARLRLDLSTSSIPL